MTFLQPYILWALPLALLPVLIHLFNRLRHRSIPWAAMMFLRSATRKSTRYARLRQFLILLFRVLAVFVLVVALSRPLAGGWAGWMFSSTPDVILVLLDRSASMESKQTEVSKREAAVRLISQSAKKLEDTSRLVLVENVTRLAQDIPNAAALPEISLSAPTDTAADVPAMVQSALDWIQQTKPGSAEIWIASDLQASNWQPQSERWPGLANSLKALPQGIRVRLLALDGEPQPNVAVSVREVSRHQFTDRSELELVIDLERNTSGPITIPLTVSIDGAPSQVEIKMDGQSLRYRHKVTLANAYASGWGYVELPADGNLRDNRSYFVYGPPPPLRATVVSDDPLCGRILQLACAPDPKNTNQVCVTNAPNEITPVGLLDMSLVLWQGPLPQGELAKQLRAFAETGGIVVFFPSGQPGQFEGSGWGEAQTAEGEKTFHISRWEEREGPLAKTEEGWSLAIPDLAVRKRQPIIGEKIWLATFDDSTPFLTRRPAGKGQILFCATLPKKEWSQLYKGEVLVPMIQRLLEAGGRRFSAAASEACGDWLPTGNETWNAVDSSKPKDLRTQAGVYRAGGKLIAINRPAREDEHEQLDPTHAKALFGQVPVNLFEEKQGLAAALQSELWRLFLFLMLLFLLVEAVLILPEKPKHGKEEEPLIPSPGPPLEKFAEVKT